MSITRKYTTEKECAELFVHDSYTNIPDSLVTENNECWFERYEFLGVPDEETLEGGADPNEDGLVHVGQPMWGTWFMFADSWEQSFVEEHAEEVAKLGFTLIYEDGYLWGLGIDGAGFDFYEAFWIPLYRLHGFEWHDEPEAG